MMSKSTKLCWDVSGSAWLSTLLSPEPLEAGPSLESPTAPVLGGQEGEVSLGAWPGRNGALALGPVMWL